MSETHVANETPDIGEEQHGRTRIPAVSLSAEYLVLGHLLRRNILMYKAPYDEQGLSVEVMHQAPG